MNEANYKSMLSAKIRHFRKSLGLTQEEFCSAINLEVTNLSNIENGKSYPSLQTMIKIQTVFKIEPNEFWSFVNWEPVDKNPLDMEISQYVKTLSDEMKSHILEIVKNLSNQL